MKKDPDQTARLKELDHSHIAHSLHLREAYQTEVERLRRLYAALSQINHVIIHIPPRKELFEKVCQALVEVGGFRMAWIGWKDPGSICLTPAASWGDDEYQIADISVYVDQYPDQPCPIGISFQEGKSIISNDFLNASNTLSWREIARDNQLLSGAAFPIHFNGNVAGILSVYADQQNFFQEAETKLLEAATADISFALENLQREKLSAQAEKKAHSEFRFSTAMLDSMPGIVYFYDEEQIFLRWNRNFQIVSGYSDTEIASMGPLDFFSEQDREIIEARINKVFETGESSIEALFVTKQGQKIPYLFTGRRVIFEDKPCLVGIGIDISDLKETQRALISSEEERDSFFNLSLDLLCVASFDGNLEQINPAWSRALGWSHDELLATPLLDFIHSDEKEQTSHIIQQLASGQAVSNLECRFRCKDNSFRWLSWNSYPLVKQSKIFAVVRDITDQKIYHTRLAEQATFLNKATDAIFAWDLEHRIVYWNKSASTLYGWEADEVVDKSLKQLFDLSEETIESFSECLFRTGEWSGELQTASKKGTSLIVEVRLTLFYDEHGLPKTVLAINTDITDRKQLEAQFLRAQRLESIGTLTGGIAHDLNNILAPILMSIEILKMSAPSRDYIETLQTLEAGATRGADLVKKLLVFGRGADGQRVLLDLAALIQDVHQVIHETLPKNMNIELNTAEAVWPINGDPTQLQQVLFNLCVNARDAMPNGGTLHIGLKNVEVDATYAAMNPGATPGKYTMMKISDTGTGISPENLERIFEPFFTTKEVGSGTGLGLSTTMALVKSHNGFINVKSELNHGTTFCIYIPANPEGLVAKETVSTTRPNLPRGNGEWILVVDDEVGIRKIAQITLEKFGYNVLLATNGAEAVSVFTLNQDKVDLVITDMAMPTMDGHSLIAALKSMDPSIPIIGSSGLAKNQIPANAVGPTYQLFLGKPYNAETLLTAIHSLLSN